jgi:hypothetical protein
MIEAYTIVIQNKKIIYLIFFSILLCSLMTFCTRKINNSKIVGPAKQSLDYCSYIKADTIGNFYFHDENFSDSLTLTINKVYIKDRIYRIYTFTKGLKSDTLILNELSPLWAFKDTLSKEQFLFFGNSSSNFNIGNSYPIGYGLKYLTMHKERIECNNGNYTRFLIVSKNLFLGTTIHPIPKLFTELVIDSNAHIIVVKHNNKEYRLSR